ncbi:hypothetical protein [uncultured Cloacibacillus sp.]|uniref:hypothetical protein n=1 Tax=uncultured Cloacibacillus sp. TaxID=889794 RepID=UPI0026DAEC07|nr:hypothetical protein [uncultured Cloacibacillus sp.]
MLAYKVTPQEFQQIVTSSDVIYNTTTFCELNKKKVDYIDYLIVKKDESPRFAVIFGVKDSQASCPFSAPFGTLLPLKKSSSVENYDDALSAIDIYASDMGLKKIFFRIPPIFYEVNALTALVSSLFRHGYEVHDVDVNYAFNLYDVYENYDSIIHYNAKKNLRIALKSNLELQICNNEEDIISAYNIIAQNRSCKGYPLRMTQDQVLETLSVVAHDVFIVQHEGQGIASAIVYHVNDKIAQVIYWGDIPGVTHLKSINYLAYQLIQYYGAKGCQYLDIGPSTENSIPNYGLCDFKESIGCERSLKFAMEKCI